MPLTNSLITNFVKATKDDIKKTNKESFVYGKMSGQDENGKYYVRMDGSNIDTPVSSFTSNIDTTIGKRVLIMIKNRSVIVTGNI